MTDAQVTLILAHIKQLEASITHANVVTTDRLARLEGTVAGETQRVTRLEGRVDADIKAREDDESGSSVTRGRVIAFLSGAGLVVLGQALPAVIPHL